MANNYYIYTHFTKDTNELFYIGIGSKYRINSKSGRNNYWKNIVDKHGYTKHIIMDNFTNRDDAVKEEIRLQKLNKPRACLKYGDCNDVGWKHNEETKEKISLSKLGKPAWNSGKTGVYSDKARASMGASKIGKSQSKNTISQRVNACQKSVINCRGNIFKSAKEAAESFGIKSRGNITMCVKNKAKSDLHHNLRRR